jgi:hypothetical protein
LLTITSTGSICWGSGGGGFGRVVSSFLGGSSCALSALGCPTGGSGAGVAELGSGSSNPKADEVLTKQNQIYHQTSRKSRRYNINKELHSQRGFLHGGLLKPQYHHTNYFPREHFFTACHDHWILFSKPERFGFKVRGLRDTWHQLLIF